MEEYFGLRAELSETAAELETPTWDLWCAVEQAVEESQSKPLAKGKRRGGEPWATGTWLTAPSPPDRSRWMRRTRSSSQPRIPGRSRPARLPDQSHSRKDQVRFAAKSQPGHGWYALPLGLRRRRARSSSAFADGHKEQ